MEGDEVMKTKGILHNELAGLVARVGHGDMIVVTDRGFPFPRHDMTTCIDLSIGCGMPKVADVIRVILTEMEIEQVIIADETKALSPETYQQFRDLVSPIRNKGNEIIEENIPHSAFRDLVLNGPLNGKEVKGFVRCGECTPYANMILISGVDF